MSKHHYTLPGGGEVVIVLGYTMEMGYNLVYTLYLMHQYPESR